MIHPANPEILSKTTLTIRNAGGNGNDYNQFKITNGTIGHLVRWHHGVQPAGRDEAKRTGTTPVHVEVTNPNKKGR